MTEIKDILDTVLAETGFQPLNAYFASTNQNAKQIWRLANRSASMLATFRWPDLIKVHTVTLQDGVAEYDLPDDYQGLIFDTMRVQGRITPVDVSTAPDEWADLKASGVGSGCTYRTRFYGSKMHVHEPIAGDVLRFEYWSNTPITNSTGQIYSRRFSADTDLWLLDRDLLEMDLMWRFRRMKGLEYAGDREQFLTYERHLKAQKRPAKTLHLVRAEDDSGEPHTNLWK